MIIDTNSLNCYIDDVINHRTRDIMYDVIEVNESDKINEIIFNIVKIKLDNDNCVLRVTEYEDGHNQYEVTGINKKIRILCDKFNQVIIGYSTKHYDKSNNKLNLNQLCDITKEECVTTYIFEGNIHSYISTIKAKDYYLQKIRRTKAFSEYNKNINIDLKYLLGIWISDISDLTILIKNFDNISVSVDDIKFETMQGFKAIKNVFSEYVSTIETLFNLRSNIL